MNSFFKKMWVNIISSDIFRRKYIVYTNKEKTEYYVKTYKLFFCPKYINFSNRTYFPNLYTCFLVKNAKLICKIDTLERAKEVISMYKKKYSHEPHLHYRAIWRE